MDVGSPSRSSSPIHRTLPTENNDYKYDRDSVKRVRAAKKAAIATLKTAKPGRSILKKVVKSAPLFQDEASIAEAKKLATTSERVARLKAFFGEGKASPEEQAEIVFLMVKEKITCSNNWKSPENEIEQLENMKEASSKIIAYKRLGDLYKDYFKGTFRKQYLVSWIGHISVSNSRYFSGESLARFQLEIESAKSLINGK